MKEASNKTENQVAPCGIVCGPCPLGNGTIAETAGRTRQLIADCQIPMWAPFVPGGEMVDWAAVNRDMEWMEKYACCAGCESGGGLPIAPSRSVPGKGDTSYVAFAMIRTPAPISNG